MNDYFGRRTPGSPKIAPASPLPSGNFRRAAPGFSLGAGLGVLMLLVSAPSRADREMANLMSMDHVMLEADFVGVVRVRSNTLEGAPATEDEAASAMATMTSHVVLEVQDVWATRWEDTDLLDFRVRPDAVRLEPQERYVVLMSGGPYQASPFTHRRNSIFRILGDDQIECASGTPLFGVLADGFLCTAASMVVGTPLALDQMHEQFDRARDRARDRQPTLARALDTEGRRLAIGPTADAGVHR